MPNTNKKKQALEDKLEFKLESKLNLLESAFISISDKDNFRNLLLDLLTPNEIDSLSGRLMAAKLIKEKIPYRSIHAQTGVSLVTISRVARSLNYGYGGYELFLSNIKKDDIKW